jgi:hypothetical protein
MQYKFTIQQYTAMYLMGHYTGLVLRWPCAWITVVRIFTVCNFKYHTLKIVILLLLLGSATIYFTKCCNWVGSIPTLYLGDPRSKTRPGYLETEVFCGFLELNQTNARIISPIRSWTLHSTLFPRHSFIILTIGITQPELLTALLKNL